MYPAMHPATQTFLEKEQVKVFGECTLWVGGWDGSLCSSSLNPGFPIFQIGVMLVHFTGEVVVSIKLEFPWRVLGIACDFYEVLSKKA